ADPQLRTFVGVQLDEELLVPVGCEANREAALGSRKVEVSSAAARSVGYPFRLRREIAVVKFRRERSLRAELSDIGRKELSLVTVDIAHHANHEAGLRVSGNSIAR